MVSEIAALEPIYSGFRGLGEGFHGLGDLGVKRRATNSWKMLPTALSATPRRAFWRVREMPLRSLAG